MAKPRQSRARSPSETQLKRGAGELRLIAGQYRGRRLPVLNLAGLRPTGDRVRETLFNWLQNDVAGSRCLDAFAGTGALGFEAASRYAKSVTLVEASAEAAAALEQSRSLLAADSVEVLHQSYFDFVASKPAPFDLVFIDPPFEEADYGAILGSLATVVSRDTLVYVECPKRLPDSSLGAPNDWQVVRDKNFGDVRTQLFRCMSHA